MEHAWATDHFSAYAAPGTTYSFGWATLRNAGPAPAVLDAVRLDESGGLMLLDSFTVPTTEIPYGIADWPSFPPPEWEDVRLVPAVGYAVPPYDRTLETDIVLLLKLGVPDTKGAHSFSGIVVDYQVGPSRYRIAYPYALRVCAPKEAFTYCGLPNEEPVEAGGSPRPRAGEGPLEIDIEAPDVSDRVTFLSPTEGTPRLEDADLEDVVDDRDGRAVVG